jgi:hypothetical protein
MSNRIEGDTYVNGNLAAQTVTLPASAVTNASVVALAGISASKLQHQHRQVYSQPNTTATAVTQVIHHVVGATGTVQAFSAGSIAIAVGAATVTVDLKKNGSTMLTGVITLDSANTAYVAEAGTLAGTSVVAGDVLTIVTTATAGGGTIATGLFVSVTINEDAQ